MAGTAGAILPRFSHYAGDFKLQAETVCRRGDFLRGIFLSVPGRLGKLARIGVAHALIYIGLMQHLRA